MTTPTSSRNRQDQSREGEGNTILNPYQGATDPNKRVLMPVIRVGEEPTYPDSMAPVRPGVSSAMLIRQHLQHTPRYPLVIYEASPVPLDRPEDIPYLEQEVTELEDFLNDPSQGSVALRRTVSDFLQFRRGQLSTASKKVHDQTDKLPPAPRSTPQPDSAVRRLVKRLLG